MHNKSLIFFYNLSHPTPTLPYWSVLYPRFMYFGKYFLTIDYGILEGNNQIDYILVKKRFRSGVNIRRTRSFPGADIGSDHDLVMMTFQIRLKKTRKPNQPRLRFDLEKLRDPDVACTFQATIGGKFAPHIGLSDEDMDMNTMITTYNTAVTDAASEILGKERRRKKPWVTKDVLDLCDERRV